MSARGKHERFRPGDKERLAKRAGDRCEWYPKRLRVGPVWRRCPFTSEDIRYFQMGHFEPLRPDDDGLPPAVSDWETNGIHQCAPCNAEQNNDRPSRHMVNLVVRDRNRLAGVRATRTHTTLICAAAVIVAAFTFTHL